MRPDRRLIATAPLIVLVVAALIGCDGPLQPLASGPDDTLAAHSEMDASDRSGGAYVGGTKMSPGIPVRPTLAISSNGMAALQSGDALQSFATRAEFEEAAPGVLMEDFEGTLVADAEICVGAFNSATDNACFSPGAIREGISIRALEVDAMVVLRPPFAGVTVTVVGPEYFGDTPEVSFGAGGVDAVGLELLAPAGGPAPVTVEIFGSDGTSLGSLPAQTGDTSGEFWGVVSEVPVSRMVFMSAEDVGILFARISFRTVESATEVEVEVQQGSVNPRSRGLIPVAVRSTDAFDATTIDPSTVRFGPAGASPFRGIGRVTDIDGDGRPDLLFHFSTPDVGFGCDDTEATLEGKTLDGRAVQGLDNVRIVCRPDTPGASRGSDSHE